MPHQMKGIIFESPENITMFKNVKTVILTYYTKPISNASKVVDTPIQFHITPRTWSTQNLQPIGLAQQVHDE